MDHLSTYEVFFHAYILKRLLIQKYKATKCQYEKSERLTNRGSEYLGSFVRLDSLKMFYEDFMKTFEQSKFSEDLKREIKWDEETGKKTYEMYKKIYEKIAVILNLRNTKSEKRKRSENIEDIEENTEVPKNKKKKTT